MTSAVPPKTGTTTDAGPKTLRYRVTKKGHGQIFTGTNDPKTLREIKFNEGDEFDGLAENCEALEERGLAKVITPLPEEPLPQPAEPCSDPGPKTLRYRVTKKGHGWISTGVNDPKTFRDIMFNEGDEFDGPAENREAYEERGLAKVVTPRPPVLQREEPRSEKPRNEQAAALQNSPATSVVDPEAMARLAARARRDEATGCLIWQGSKANGGYGQITYRRKLHTTHRLAWVAQRGDVPANHYVCHACDNPACIAIEHLFLGTPQDNYRDTRQKGRSRYNSKLEIHEVAAIKKRLAQGETAVKVAKDYAVRYDQILNIKRGTAWREVAAEGTE